MSGEEAGIAMVVAGEHAGGRIDDNGADGIAIARAPEMAGKRHPVRTGQFDCLPPIVIECAKG